MIDRIYLGSRTDFGMINVDFMDVSIEGFQPMLPNSMFPGPAFPGPVHPDPTFPDPAVGRTMPPPISTPTYNAVNDDNSIYNQQNGTG